MQGDRIVGKETIPILLGEKRALSLLKSILAANLGLMLLAGAFHLIPTLGFVLTVCPIFMFIVLLFYSHHHIQQLCASVLRPSSHARIQSYR